MKRLDVGQKSERWLRTLRAGRHANWCHELAQEPVDSDFQDHWALPIWLPYMVSVGL
jgi:hypothetical protein